MVRELLSLIIAGGAFCGSHVLLSSTRLRGSLRDQLGERGFLAVYSVTALVIFAWFVSAYAGAPTIVLWPRQRWTALVPVLVMPLATILLVAGYSTRNPTAVGMERSASADDPAPGILRVTRHPVMWAIGLWAISHLIANGDAASLLFFGALGALALGGTVLIDRKKQLALGSNWPRLDVRVHGGSDPVAHDYTMAALAGDVATALDVLGIGRFHYMGLSIGGMIGQAFAIAHGDRLISAMWCDTLPASPKGAADQWAQRMSVVRQANSLEPLAEPTMERWFTDAFKPQN